MSDILQNVQNETDTWDGDMVGRRWIMGEEQLRCIDCDDIEPKHGKSWKKHLIDELPEPPPPPAPVNKKYIDNED